MNLTIFEVMGGSSWLHRASRMAAVTTIMAFILLVVSSPAWANTFTVNKTEDTNDGHCGSGSTGDCTLREAVIAANYTLEDDQINLPAGTYNLAIPKGDTPDPLEEDARKGDLDILGRSGKTTIEGVGPDDTVINGRGIDRVFDVTNDASAEIRGLKITGGQASTDTGTNPSGRGGGVRVGSRSSLNLNNVVISGNESTGSNPGGGAIYTSVGSNLNISNSTVSNNTSSRHSGGIYYSGGIYNVGDMRMTNVTVSDNTGAGLWLAGIGNTRVYRSSVINNGDHGISNHGTNLTVIDSTISGNRYGIVTYGNATLINSTLSDNYRNFTSSSSSSTSSENHFLATIIANPRGDTNCRKNYGTVLFTSDGYNLEYPGKSCGFTATSDVRNQNPLLSPLAYNGGPTKSHALRPASPAIDVARTLCSPRDQRYIQRPKDGNGDGEKVCDIGSYEAPDVTDTARPTITGLRPVPGARVRDRTPTIRVVVRDNYTNLAKSDIKLYVDGRRKTSFSYNRNTERLSYTTGRLRTNQRHTVKIVAKDAAGNVAQKSWSFRVRR